jgi:hypothetical protein
MQSYSYEIHIDHCVQIDNVIIYGIRMLLYLMLYGQITSYDTAPPELSAQVTPIPGSGSLSTFYT